MKTLGIIGGFGPETSAKFMLEVISQCSKKGSPTRPQIMMFNAPVDPKLEKSFAHSKLSQSHFSSLIMDGASSLENSGADFLVLPCNTLHSLFDDIKKTTTLPVLNLLDESTRFLTKKGTKRIGLLATSTTIKKKLFDLALSKSSIKLTKPTVHQQVLIDKIIRKILAGEVSQKDTELIEKIIETLKNRGCDSILLACTDLQLLKIKAASLPIFDTLQILANASVEKILEE